MKYWQRKSRQKRENPLYKLVFLLTVLTLLSSSLPLVTRVEYTTLYTNFPLLSSGESVYYVTSKVKISQGNILKVWHFGKIKVYKMMLDTKEVIEISKIALGVFSPEKHKISVMDKPYTLFSTTLTQEDLKQYHRKTSKYLGNGTTVCIIDTGIDFLHPDFFRNDKSVVSCMVSMYFISNSNTYLTWIPEVNGSLEDAWELEQDIYKTYGMYAWMDENGHGTHVAGIIASQGNMGFVGLAPGVDLVIVKAFDKLGVAGLDIVLEALEWVYNNTARYKIRIVNISWGSRGDNRGIDPLSLVIDYMTDKLGLIFVCAMGNSGNVPFTVNIPACARRAVAVGAFDPANRKIAEFSSFGTTVDLRIKPDFVGAGVNIISCKPVTIRSYIEEMYPQVVYNNYYMVLSGTSMATPCVVSVYASYIQKLLTETNTKPSYTTLYNELVKNSEHINRYYKDFISGWGIPLICD
ncbi:MAG: hypothetical protein DRO40_11130 [Thermoprotei archaeon]|nr:MAG: hypothetical protein DRO40_11130 [Thermoprotei archaeon]